MVEKAAARVSSKSFTDLMMNLSHPSPERL